jgi:hypothetical protein
MSEEEIMSPEKEKRQSKLNPQITDTEIGVRELRKITIYPLSMADQLSMTDLITEAIQTFFTGAQGFESEEQDMEFMAFVVGLIKENLSKVIEFVTDEKGEDVLQDLTNEQASVIATIIYDVNYEPVIKNSQSLAERIRNLIASRSTRPSPQSVNDTDIDSTISTDGPSEKEDSQ